MSYRTRLLTVSLIAIFFCYGAGFARAQESVIDTIPIGEGQAEEAAMPEGEGSLAEEVAPECGNGRIETGEQCDPATRTEAYADYCDEQCQLRIPPALTDCYRQEYADCRRDKIGDALDPGPAKVNPSVVDQEGTGSRTETETERELDQECVDLALLVCDPEEPEPVADPPAAPIAAGGEEGAVVPNVPGFDVSGSGCTLQVGKSPLPASLLIWGVVLVGWEFFRRRRVR